MTRAHASNGTPAARTADMDGGQEGEHRLLHASLQTVDTIRQLIADLLDVSRIEEGILRLEPAEIDIRDLVTGVANSVGTVDVTIDVVAKRDDGGVEIRVSDEGPGVPSDIMPRVFMRYARKPRSTGLGIGLYLAERIATAHGGWLMLDSTPTGATFVLRLPDRERGSSEEGSLVYTGENGARDDRMRS